MANTVVPTRGMRDFLPAEKAKRERILNILRQTYTSLGFFEIETPVMEPISRMKSGQGGENESMLFEILRRGLEAHTPITPAEAVDLGMRYDLTLPLSRYYASHQAELPQVFRAFQTGPVWRAERPQKGRYRQFNQCDIDIIGAPSYSAEVEVLATAWIAMQKLGLDAKAKVLINDRRLLTALMDCCEIPAQLQAGTLISLDKIDKIGSEKVALELVERQKINQVQAAQLLETVSELENYQLSEEKEVELSNGKVIPLFDLPEIVNALKDLHPGINVEFTPRLVRGMGYYTGPIFEVEHTEFGSSICGGGRYDGVIGKWIGKDVPAVGFSFGFERIVDLVTESEETTSIRLALVYQKDHEAIKALSLREAFQESGVETVGLAKGPRKLGGAFFEQLRDLGYTHAILPSGYLGAKPEDVQMLIMNAKVI